MLSPQELRIGNAVLYKDQIKLIDVEDLQNIKSEDYKPLLINPERLYRFDFMDADFECWEHEHLEFVLIVIDNSYYQYLNADNEQIGRSMLYVHELQNRCYSMTGAELIMRTDERPVTGQ